MGYEKISSGDLPRKLAVVPKYFPKNYLLEVQAAEIETLISSNIANGFKSEYYPRVDSCMFSDEGAFIVACPDEHTETWLTLLIGEKQVRFCPALKVINIEDIPQFTKCSVYLPKGTDIDLKLFEHQNRGVNTAYWRIIASPASPMNNKGSFPKVDPLHYELMVDEHSREVLKANNYSLYYSLSKVKFEDHDKLERDPTTGCLDAQYFSGAELVTGTIAPLEPESW